MEEEGWVKQKKIKRPEEDTEKKGGGLEERRRKQKRQERRGTPFGESGKKNGKLRKFSDSCLLSKAFCISILIFVFNLI